MTGTRMSAPSMSLEGLALTIGYRDRVVGTRARCRARDRRSAGAARPERLAARPRCYKTLLGLLTPKAGDVRLGARSLAAIPVQERARLIAYVPQTHISTFAFTVATVVLMGRTAHGNLFSRPSAHDRAVAMQALERFGIAISPSGPTP